MKLTIATRNSPLALAQTHLVKQALLEKYPELEIDLLPLTTTGDQWLNKPLADIGGKGLFTKELEDALLRKQADIAVHSMKDMPAELPAGLTLGAICPRGPIHDVFIHPRGERLAELAPNSKIGTSSLRRACQLHAIRPDCEAVTLRGNINTRLAKLLRGEYDAIVLAYAGLDRLSLDAPITEHFDPVHFLPALGQGTLGIECRIDDEQTQTILQSIQDRNTTLCLQAERALSFALGGNCHVPLAGFATLEGETLTLRAMVGHPSGQPIYRSHLSGSINSPEKLGQHVAQDLLDQGAGPLLNL